MEKDKNNILIIDKDDSRREYCRKHLCESFNNTDIIFIDIDDEYNTTLDCRIDLILFSINYTEYKENYYDKLLHSNHTKDSTIILINDGYEETDETFIQLLNELQAIDYICTPINPHLLTNKIRLHLKLKNRIKQLESRLAETKTDYRSIVELQTELIIKANPDLQITFANHSMCNYFNINENDILGDNLLNFIPEERKPSVKNKLAMLNPRYPVIRYDTYYSDISDFDRNWIRWSTRAVYDMDKKLIEYHSVGRDITAWKLAEDIIRNSEDRYKSLFRRMTNAYAYQKIIQSEGENALDSVFLEVNDAFEKHTGLSRESVIGKKASQIFPEIKARESSFYKHYILVPSRGNNSEIELYVESLKRWLYINSYPLYKGFFATIIEDVTEDKEKLLQLQDTLDKFKTLFRKSKDAIFVYKINKDMSGRFIDVNDTACEILGYTKEEILTKTPEDLTINVSLNKGLHRTNIKDKVFYEGSVLFEANLRTKTGKSITVEINSGMIRFKDEQYIFSLARDIDQRKKAENMLKESEARFKSIFENSPAGILIFDSDGKLLDINQSTLKMVNLKDKNCYKNNLNLLDNPYIEKKYIKKLKQGKMVKFETDIDFDKIADRFALNFSKKGRIYVEVIITPVKVNQEPNSPIKNFFLQFNDLTERVKAEQKLRRSEQRANAIIQDQTELIIRYTPEFIITFVNQAYARYFGYSKEELIGSCLLDYFPDSQKKEFSKFIKQLSRDNPVDTMEYVGVVKSWLKWQEWVHRAILDENGNIIEYQSVGRDITEQKRYKDMLEKALKNLQQKNDELSHFAHHISHDLKNPLASLISYIRIIQYKYVEQMNEPELKEITDSVMRKTSNMVKMIEDLLLYSELDNPETGFELVDMNEVFSTALEYLEELIKKTDAQITSDKLPDDVFAIKTYMVSLFQNLISNAIKYRKCKEKPVIHISSTEQDNHYMISVKDNGIGIKKENHETIFQIFKRVKDDEDDTEDYVEEDITHSSGIGLSFCKKIVEIHRGQIFLESEYGKGSTFSFTIKKKESMV